MSKERVKILQIGPYPPPLGGWSYHIRVFKEYLDKNGYKNHVINIGESRRNKSLGCIDVQNYLDYIMKNIKFLIKGYIIYNHVDGCSWKGFVLTITSQVLSVFFLRPTFLSFHAGLNQHCFKEGKWVYSAMAKIVFKMSKKIICNSEEVKRRILEFGIDEERIFPISCFSHQYLNFKETIYNEQYEFIRKRSPLLFTYVFFRDEFTIDILIESIKKLLERYPELGLIIAGSTKGSEEISHLISKLGIKEHIFFAGDISHDNFLSLLSKSDLYIRTHLNDGVCSSVLEALSLGVPVVASYNEMRPKSVLTFRGGDEEDLYKKIRYALENLKKIKGRLEYIQLRDTFKEELAVLVGR